MTLLDTWAYYYQKMAGTTKKYQQDNFQKMKAILTNNSISKATRRKALQCYIEPILMYGCEAWTLNKQVQKKLEAVEIWLLRRILRIPWTQKKSNVAVSKEADARRSLINRRRKRQATFIGHAIRRDGLEHLVTTGMLEGKRGRGRQREKILDGLISWFGVKRVTDILLTMKDREYWRGMIANAMEQGTG